MKPGDVVLVKFPFSDLTSNKKRPALVITGTKLTSKISIITIAMITSKVEGLKLNGDCKITHWQSSGLLHPSLIRFSKIASIDNDLIERTLGRLSTADMKESQSTFETHFKPFTSLKK